MWDFNVFKPSQDTCAVLILSVNVLVLQQRVDLV